MHTVTNDKEYVTYKKSCMQSDLNCFVYSSYMYAKPYKLLFRFYFSPYPTQSKMSTTR